MSLNRFVGIGNLTRSPEVRYTPKGTAVCDIGVAVNRRYSVDGEKRESTTFLDVTYFGTRGEAIAEYLKKGDPIYIEARLENQSWDDKETGQKRHKIALIGESFEFIGSKREESAPPQRPTNRPPERKAMPPKPPRDHDLDADEEDIPF